MAKQKIIRLENGFEPIEECIKDRATKKLFLVCDSSIEFLEIGKHLSELSGNTGAEIVKFSDFKSNPDYRSVVKAVDLFRNNKCDFILTIGGGSAIDVAKCVKLYALAELPADGLPEKCPPNDIPLAAMPTTAGTGSESTRFAVIYLNGKKQSIEDDSILPEYAFLDERVLQTLPEYQKKATMLDALSHSVESYWSVNSTDKSRALSLSAIKIILSNHKEYFCGDWSAAREILNAANLAGQAINITRTTAAHAMSYKLTSVFGIAHGHAAFICLLGLLSRLNDREELHEALEGLSEAVGGDLEKSLSEFYSGLSLRSPVCTDENVIQGLAREVNVERLKNFPILLTAREIEDIYREILGGSTHK